MSMFLNLVVNVLQLPADGLTVAEARDIATNISTGQELPASAEGTAKAVQDQQMEPASGTPESTENGAATNVKTQPTHEGA